MIGILPVRDLYLRSATGVDELARMLGAADHEIVGEVFKFTHPRAIEAVAGRGSGVRATMLMDPEVFAKKGFRPTRQLLESGGAQIHPFGEMPRKVHAKGFVTDAEQGWLSTSPIMELGDAFDVTARFSGDAARALRNLTLTTIERGAKAQRRAAAEAARHGILLNDRHAGITQLREGIKHVIDSADRELVIVTKSITDEKLAARIARRAREGVDVHIATQREQMSRGVRRIFDKAGIAFHDDVYGRIHGNAIVANGQLAYFGSGHLTGRAMVRGAGYRSSRELGALVGGEHAATIRQGILDLSESLPRRG